MQDELTNSLFNSKMSNNYKRNHYVPEWYQHRFLPNEVREKKFFYLDLKPDILFNNGHKYTRKALLRWGPDKCFCKDDLYTTKFGKWESTEIEEKFFGKIDQSGITAIEYFTNFDRQSADSVSLKNLLLYMSTQKLRTPKGMACLEDFTKTTNKNHLLLKLQELQQLYCALWTESIWSIADASNSKVKFILSDHPITVYNQSCSPKSKWCCRFRDPDIWLSGTHTLFPLNYEKVLILTNLSWIRNPYGNPTKSRPNPILFRPVVFNFLEIQTGRFLTNTEVAEINYIIKSRAYRYVASANEEWLHPERIIPTQRWENLGNGYLLMPDPRSIKFSSEYVFGYESGPADLFDEYGRKPWQNNYDNKSQRDKEWKTFSAFKGEFARVIGPKRRGVSNELGAVESKEDSPEFHAFHLALEEKYKPKCAKRKQR